MRERPNKSKVFLPRLSVSTANKSCGFFDLIAIKIPRQSTFHPRRAAANNF
jgi:hypothetical protein